jgi:hypothetical protein
MYVRSEDYKKIFNSLKKLTFNIGRPNIIFGIIGRGAATVFQLPTPKILRAQLVIQRVNECRRERIRCECEGG